MNKRTSPRKIDFPFGKGYNTRVVIYVPSTTKNKEGKDIPISRKEFMKRIKNTSGKMATMFGGVTRITGLGSWYNDKKRLVMENIAKVEAFAPTKSYKKQDVELEKFVRKQAKEWKQDQVSFEFETPERPASTLYFASGK